MRIEILVFDGVDEMDVMGPFEVWSHASRRPGSMLLAEAGLVKGRAATTNRGAWTELEALGADVADGIAGVMEYTRDRDVFVSAG